MICCTRRWEEFVEMMFFEEEIRLKHLSGNARCIDLNMMKEKATDCSVLAFLEQQARSHRA